MIVQNKSSYKALLLNLESMFKKTLDHFSEFYLRAYCQFQVNYLINSKVDKFLMVIALIKCNSTDTPKNKNKNKK